MVFSRLTPVWVCISRSSVSSVCVCLEPAVRNQTELPRTLTCGQEELGIQSATSLKVSEKIYEIKLSYCLKYQWWQRVYIWTFSFYTTHLCRIYDSTLVRDVSISQCFNWLFILWIFMLCFVNIWLLLHILNSYPNIPNSFWVGVTAIRVLFIFLPRGNASFFFLHIFLKQSHRDTFKDRTVSCSSSSSSSSSPPSDSVLMAGSLVWICAASPLPVRLFSSPQFETIQVVTLIIFLMM